MIHPPRSNSSRYSSLSFIFRGLSLIGGLGLISSGFVLADTPAESQSDQSVPTAAELLQPIASAASPSAAAPSALSAPEPSPVVPQFSQNQPTGQPQASPAPVVKLESLLQSVERSNVPSHLLAPTGTTNAIESAPLERVETPAAPESVLSPAAPNAIAPSSIPASESAPPRYTAVFIDPTDYSIGATQNPDLPSIVLSERTTGCQITLEQGDGVPTNLCSSPFAAVQTAVAVPQSAGNASFNIGPINISPNGISVGATSTASREYYNRMVRPLNSARQGEQEFIFPLSIPAPITSLFGWRMHPIHNVQRFHTGTDLGAPFGTPILAAQAGRVAVSNLMGGYGLTVVLRHDDGTTESLYGHMSQLLVKPGEEVEQGEVIGLVGSTGNSTGPHLHFEVRQLTGDGWFALDPTNVLQYSLAQLMQTLENPLAAFALEGEAEESEFQLPFRPAQPNAS